MSDIEKQEDAEFPSKLLEKLPEGFADGMQSADTEEIKKKILESEGHLYEIDIDQGKDEKLAAAKDDVKLLSKAYRDAKKTEATKIKYCIFVLETRGVHI